MLALIRFLSSYLYFQQNANLYGHHPYHMTMEKTGDAHGILFLNSNAMEIHLSPLPAVTYRC